MNMFNGQRSFRTIILTSTARSLDEVLKLVPRDSISQQYEKFSYSETEPAIWHGFFYSETAYADPNKLAEIRMPYLGVEKYRYDFYACEVKLRRATAFVLSVPFAAMAEQMFEFIDEKSRRFKRKYKRVGLSRLSTYMQEDGARASDVIVSSARFRLDGGDSVKSVEMSGKDVFSSEIFRRSKENLKGLQLVPRRLRVRFGISSRRLTFETDIHGNFWIQVSKDAKNLGMIGSVLGFLEQADVLLDTLDYPLRRGVRDEENDDDL